MAFMTDDVINKGFTEALRRGYDEQEVDEFLDEVAVELCRLTSDNDDLRELIPADALDKVAAARMAAEKAEQNSAARIAKADADAQRAEAEAAERAKVATEAADEIAKSALAVGVPVPAKDEGHGMAGVGGADATGLGSAAGLLALAQKMHDEYVTEGQTTRERLISEGQSLHDQVVGEGTARHEELLSNGRAKHDELVSVGEAKRDTLIAEAEPLRAEAAAEHEHMITEARERSTAMVAKAQHERAEVLQVLGHERNLLQKEIEELRTMNRDHRAHLKSYLEGQLVELAQTGVAETG